MRQRPEFPYRRVSGWKLALIVLGTLAVPVLNNLSQGLPRPRRSPVAGS